MERAERILVSGGLRKKIFDTTISGSRGRVGGAFVECECARKWLIFAFGKNFPGMSIADF
jgi:hypothetical protein